MKYSDERLECIKKGNFFLLGIMVGMLVTGFMARYCHYLDEKEKPPTPPTPPTPPNLHRIYTESTPNLHVVITNSPA
jgi:hypothetical protein